MHCHFVTWCHLFSICLFPLFHPSEFPSFQTCCDFFVPPIFFHLSPQEVVQETLEGAMERLDLVLGECVHKYQSSLVRLPVEKQYCRLRGNGGHKVIWIRFTAPKDERACPEFQLLPDRAHICRECRVQTAHHSEQEE